MKKRGAIILVKAIIFIVLNLVFLAGLLFFVARAGTGDAAYEQAYAKQIALLIDQAKTGTTLAIDISKLYGRARENKYYGNVVALNPAKKEIIVKLINEGQGYSMNYFSKAEISVLENRLEGELRIYVT